VRQLLTESLMLSAGGGLLGLAIGWWGSEALQRLAAAQIPRSWEIGFDWRVFAFLLGACATSGLMFGVVPAATAVGSDADAALTRSSDLRVAGRGSRRLRDSLVVAELALAFVLIVGAGLLLREFVRLQRTPSGFVAENVLTLHLTRDLNSRTFYDLERRVGQLPGVRSAGFIQF